MRTFQLIAGALALVTAMPAAAATDADATLKRILASPGYRTAAASIDAKSATVGCAAPIGTLISSV